MNSALYSGWISHRRFAPRRHAFRYRIGLLYLDLAERDSVLGLSPLAGHSRFAPFAWREQVALALGEAPQGAVRLLTQARSWGLSFNPVSFFYCFDSNDRLAAILCEVTNTPWGERYHYVLAANGEGHQHVTAAKSFHVSPFLPRDLQYRMSFSQPGERLGVHMADWQGELKLFDATLDLQRQALSRASLHRYLWHFPWMSAKTCLSIYWQALRLLLKRTPIFSHQAADGAFGIATAHNKEQHHEKF